jgi:hypothetical protein
MYKSKEYGLNLSDHKEAVSGAFGTLNSREYIERKKTWLKILPVLFLGLFLLVIYGANNLGLLGDNQTYSSLSKSTTIIWFGLFFPYIGLFSLIFYIEKIIWSQSFFDKKNLLPNDSWNIAKKLFLPYLSLCAAIFLRYALLPLILFYLFLSQVAAPLADTALEIKNYLPWIGMMLVLSMEAYLLFMLKPVFKFLPFIFLDTYGTDEFSYSSILREAKKFTKIANNKKDIRGLSQEVVEELGAIASAKNQKFIGFSTGVENDSEARKKLAWNEVQGERLGSPGRVPSLTQIIPGHIAYRSVKAKLYPAQNQVNENLYKL